MDVKELTEILDNIDQESDVLILNSDGFLQDVREVIWNITDGQLQLKIYGGTD